MWPITVLIADAQRMFSDALAGTLRLQDDLFVLHDYPTSGAAAAEVATRYEPDVLVLDYWMEGVGMGAPAVIRTIAVGAPNCKVIVLAWLHGPREVESALQAGAVGFLPKSLSVGHVAEAIRRAHAGERVVYAKELEDLKQTMQERGDKGAENFQKVWARLRTLTRRELQILLSLSEGRSVEDLAQEFHISPATARNHVHKILEKTGTRTQLGAITTARHYRLIP